MKLILFVCHGNICRSQHGIPFDPNKRARRIDASDYGRFERTFQDLLEACEALVDAGGGGGACDGHDR